MPIAWYEAIRNDIPLARKQKEGRTSAGFALVGTLYALNRSAGGAISVGRAPGFDSGLTIISRGSSRSVRAYWRSRARRPIAGSPLRLVLINQGSGVMRLRTGGRLDFWTLESAIAGRGRRYRRIVIDEAAF